MASYEKRGKTIRVIVSLGSGKKKTASFDTMAEAKVWGARQEKNKTLGTLTSTSSLTVTDVFEGYSPIAESQDSGRENGIRLAKWCLDPIGAIKLNAITTHDVNEWIKRRQSAVSEHTGKPVTGSTINRELNLMSAAFTWAVNTRKWIKVNPCSGAKRPPNNRSRKRPLLTAKEIEALCISSGYDKNNSPVTIAARVVTCFLFALETGMRSGETLRLRPDDYDKDGRTVFVAAIEKGGRKGAQSGKIVDASRKVPLTGRAIELLDQLLDSMPAEQEPKEGFMFPPYIVGMDDRQRDANWRKVRDRAGIEDLHYHDTKHEAATRLSKFLDVLALSHALGTKNVKLLRDTYYNNDAEKSAALLPEKLAVLA